MRQIKPDGPLSDFCFTVRLKGKAEPHSTVMSAASKHLQLIELHNLT